MGMIAAVAVEIAPVSIVTLFMHFFDVLAFYLCKLRTYTLLFWSGDNELLGGETESVSICGQIRRGRKISFDADNWFSAFLSDTHSSSSSSSNREVACSLVRCSSADPSGRAQATASAEGAAMTANIAARDIAFANTAQFLLLSLESVGALTQVQLCGTTVLDELSVTISMLSTLFVVQMILASDEEKRGSLNITAENFRPNLLVSGGSGRPHMEDGWKGLRLHATRHKVPTKEEQEAGAGGAGAGSVPLALELIVTDPCARCSMVNVDGSKGSMDCRAFQALASYRKEGASVYFGQFCALDRHLGIDWLVDDVWLRAGLTVEPYL